MTEWEFFVGSNKEGKYVYNFVENVLCNSDFSHLFCDIQSNFGPVIEYFS